MNFPFMLVTFIKKAPLGIKQKNCGISIRGIDGNFSQLEEAGESCETIRGLKAFFFLGNKTKIFTSLWEEEKEQKFLL